MNNRNPLQTIVCLATILILLVGCGSPTAAPTVTSPAAAQAATATPIPPTSTSTPVPAPPTQTAVPPTSTPTPVPPTPTPELEPGLGLALLETLTVAADGAPVSDAQGTSLQVPPGSLGDGQQAQIEVHAAAGELAEALRYAYVIETPFYAVSAQGQDDGTGRVTLTLPAADPSSRILAVFDEQYPVLLEVTPEAGTLRLNPRLGPSDTSGQEVVGSLAPGGSLHYAVIHPKDVAGNSKRAPGLAAPAQQADRSCLPKLSPAAPMAQVLAFCTRNAAGTVFVYSPPGLDPSKVDPGRVADEVAAMMAQYADLGFTAAGLTPSSPAYINLVTGGGDPKYLVASGSIHLPADSAQAVVSGKTHDLLHEMAHWIQDEEYVMSWAYWRGNQTWWLETAAENMVMLVDPAYIEENLTYYGTITLGNTLAFQNAPYQWPGDFYIHAQLVKLNMCDDPIVCPLSQASFVRAINEGSYPFDDGGAREKLSHNLDAFAHYLLGVAPGRGNGNMPLAGAVRSGDGYGEYVNIAEGHREGAWTVTFNGVDPQMKKGSERDMTTVSIQASLQKDGVYPLVVNSGASGGAHPGLPAKLTISPGAPFWYREGDGEAQFHDGSKELVLQPIHAVMGLPSVRMVALGRNGGESFQAKVEFVDLSGVWIITPQNEVSNNVVCTTSDSSDDNGDRAALAPALITYGALLGDLGHDEGDNSLTWTLVEERLPPDISASSFTYAASAIIGGQDVQLQARMDIPNQASRRMDPPFSPPVATLGGALPVALVAGYGKRRRRWFLLALVVVGLVALVGCGLYVNLYGNATGELTFNQLEYVGGEQAVVVNFGDEISGEPLWRLGGGRGTYQLDFTVVAGSTDDEGKPIESVTHCTGQSVFELTASIYQDATVQFPKQ